MRDVQARCNLKVIEALGFTISCVLLNATPAWVFAIRHTQYTLNLLGPMHGKSYIQANA